eukprot:TRINITY_DN11304_c3_g1_i2.p1 TRINITY_DN11304_c3_g1~~TRINITY_DN11304_c3_g1_i2.p1  ORF type:complete len:225 (+),score=57.59 TRINITY_DN11304_c3_g1_i2:66-677(+)
MPEELVMVNVGGQVFHTTRGTLQRCSYFDAMFRSIDAGIDVTRDSRGNIFVDRDANLFARVLHTLRGDCAHCAGTLLDGETRAELRFFGAAVPQQSNSSERLVVMSSETKLLVVATEEQATALLGRTLCDYSSFPVSTSYRTYSKRQPEEGRAAGVRLEAARLGFAEVATEMQGVVEVTTYRPARPPALHIGDGESDAVLQSS